ncbi:MAG: sulfatase-like hydrolase/transferase, partial [Candidatus Brocadiia bacterium]|nr:sulfatase-like hydrolase/transferase [Candidatus Brocadiia bacterium]
MHALEEDVARYQGAYREGWDRLRTNRHEQMKGMGLLDNKWDISPRDADAPPWENAPNQDWEDLRMAVYAAQIDRMDQGVGRVMSRVRELGQEENTLVMFLSDNGGCAELLREDGGSSRPSLYGMPTVDGRPMRLGNNTSLRPGPA